MTADLKRILITKPYGLAEALQKECAKHDFIGVCAPTIKIEPLPAIDEAILSAVEKADSAIFVSVAAVETAQLILLNSRIQKINQVFSIGPSTKRVLQDAGRDNVLMPSKMFTSEALLALPELSNVQGQRIVIFSGEDGRQMLSEALQARGAHVDSIATYRRAIPKHYETKDLDNLDCVVISSRTALKNLLVLAKDKGAYVKSCPIIVTSERLVKCVVAEDWQGPCFRASNATNSAIIKTLEELMKEK